MPNSQVLTKDTVFNWFSRYENEASDLIPSKHFPAQKSTGAHQHEFVEEQELAPNFAG